MADTDQLWRSDLLGGAGSLATSGGTLEYFDRGDGPALIFSHGWLANANLWRKVIDLLADSYRCIALDLPLGSHRQPMAESADLGPLGVAGLIADALEGLNLERVTLVGNDSGGAYSQIALAELGERIAGRVERLVLTSCETPYDEWPPEPFTALPEVARDPDALGELLGALRDPAVRASLPAYGLLLKHPVDPQVSASYALPAGQSKAVLHDVAKAMSSASTAPVRRAGERLIADAELPILLIWSELDRVFPIANAERFSAALKDARLVRIEDSYSFTPEDRPDAVAEAIASFA